MRCFSYQLFLCFMPCKMLAKDYLGGPVHHFRRAQLEFELLLALFLCCSTYYVVSPLNATNPSTQELYHVFCKIHLQESCVNIVFSPCTVCICFIGTSEINKVLEDLFTLAVCGLFVSVCHQLYYSACLNNSSPLFLLVEHCPFFRRSQVLCVSWFVFF